MNVGELRYAIERAEEERPATVPVRQVFVECNETIFAIRSVFVMADMIVLSTDK